MEPRRPHIPGPPARRRRLAALGLAALLAAGCASGPGPLAERRTMIGTLRSSVAQLESEKQGLQKDLADLRAGQRRLEDRLVQEQADNELLGRRVSEYERLGRGDRREGGFEGIDLSGPSAAEPERSPSPRARANPAAAPRSPRRPLVQIPGQIRPLEEDFDPDRPPAPRRPRDDRDGDRDRGGPTELFPALDDPYAQGRRDAAPSRWLPVARGLGPSPSRLR